LERINNGVRPDMAELAESATVVDVKGGHMAGWIACA
jgi:hypothetical protein